MKTEGNYEKQISYINNYECTISPCREYYCGRVVSFISALLSYIKNPTNHMANLDAKIYGSGNKDCYIDVVFNDSNYICNELLITKSKGIKTIIRICEITEIQLNNIIFLNTPLNKEMCGNSIILQTAEIIPPDNCREATKLKEIMQNTDKEKPFQQIKLYNLTLKNSIVYSVTEGMATFSSSDGGTIFAPFSSVFEISGSFS